MSTPIDDEYGTFFVYGHPDLDHDKNAIFIPRGGMKILCGLCGAVIFDNRPAGIVYILIEPGPHAVWARSVAGRPFHECPDLNDELAALIGGS